MMEMEPVISDGRRLSDITMKVLRNILLVMIALLVQSTLFGRFDIYGVRPDLALLVLLFIANTTGPVGNIWYGFLIGLLQDVYSPEYLGFNTLTMSITGFFLGFVREQFTVEKGAVRLLVTFIVCLAHDALYLMIYTHFDFSLLFNLYLRLSLPGALYTSVIFFVLIAFWEWAEKGGIFIVIRELMGSR